MEAFNYLTSIAAPFPDANIDTDIIFPARFLLITERKGLGRYAFYEKRFDPEGRERPDFVLNREAYRSARIIVAGDSFGTGSSREQAPWALHDLRIRFLISTSFGEIFQSNCFRNGMLPIVVPADRHALLMGDAQSATPITIDLPAARILRSNGDQIPFDIPQWRRDALINGWHEIDMILNNDRARIAAFEAGQKRGMPWLYSS